MRYVSIDIETTGLNPETCQIIEFGAVIDNDTNDEFPTFHRYIKHHSYQGEPRALSMHARIFRALADGEGICPNSLARQFFEFLTEKKAIGISKNPTGDKYKNVVKNPSCLK